MWIPSSNWEVGRWKGKGRTGGRDILGKERECDRRKR